MRGALTHCIGVVEWVTAGLTSALNRAFLALNACDICQNRARTGMSANGAPWKPAR